MALISVKETTKRGGGSSSRSTKGRKAVRTYLVRYDAPPASIATAETASHGGTAVPSLDDALPDDATRLVTDISVRPHDDTGLAFDVTVTYEASAADAVDDPLSEPVQYEWDFSASSQPYFIDTQDTPKMVTTSAGEPFENFLEREVGEIAVTITDNIMAAAWDPILAAEYMHPATAVNDAPMTVDGIPVAAEQVRMRGIKATGIKVAPDLTQYRTRTIVLGLRASWTHVVDDRGFHELDPVASGKLREVSKGTPPVKPDKPWPLDGAGAAMPNVDDEPAELTFYPYPAKDFIVWGIS